jgi:hypothetical protein
VDRSAVRTGSRPLRASAGAARISQTTASASSAKGTPTCGITVAGFRACGHCETDAHFLAGDPRSHVVHFAQHACLMRDAPGRNNGLAIAKPFSLPGGSIANVRHARRRCIWHVVQRRADGNERFEFQALLIVP